MSKFFYTVRDNTGRKIAGTEEAPNSDELVTRLQARDLIVVNVGLDSNESSTGFGKKAASLTPEAKALMVEHLTFLENEFSDLTEFQGMTWKEYREDRSKRRSIERWIENLVMSAMDIAKIVLASEKKDVPQTYREALREFGLAYFNEAFASRFCEFAELRNIVAHEYLDMRWAKIKNFIENAAELYPVFIKGVKNLLEDRKA